MKKYFTKIFKQKNKRLVRARFWNLKSTEIIRATRKTFKQYFDLIDLPDYFYHYFMGILNFRDISNMDCSIQTKRDVCKFHDCWDNYSKKRFAALFSNQSLRILWNEFLAKVPPTSKYHFMIKEIEKFKILENDENSDNIE